MFIFLLFFYEHFFLEETIISQTTFIYLASQNICSSNVQEHIHDSIFSYEVEKFTSTFLVIILVVSRQWSTQLFLL